MLRIPNPNSDIDSFIRIYQEIFEALRERKTFDLDDISRVLIERNLATSSGYMGEEALRRSYNQDRSRDRLYNQSKMFTELYKALGWLHPTPEGALIFRLTYLGAHVVAAKRDPDAIFKESILGIAYPNAGLRVKGKYILRPFATILRTIGELDGLLCRDEMIVGPMCLEDDRDKRKFQAMISELRLLRRGYKHLKEKIEEVSADRGISSRTMENYTRFPLAVMKWTGWTAEERRKDVYGRSIPFLVLTDDGRQVIEKIEAHRDLRASDLKKADEETRSAIARLGFYQMLDRAGFDPGALHDQMELDTEKATTFLGEPTKPLLFSPFQELDPEFTSRIFPTVSGVEEGEYSKLDVPTVVSILSELHSPVSLSPTDRRGITQADTELVALFTNTERIVGNNLAQVANVIAQQYRSANQTEFYPFIARLFRALGYDCDHSRPGVNYQRWDALIIDSTYSIPIEIKSPGEEEFLSVKAVRQALENKIILLSRKAFPTERDTTSLVVGYNLPNDRSEVASLVVDIHKAFNIVIGVMDLRSLLRLVAATILQNKEHDISELRNLHGIIEVADA